MSSCPLRILHLTAGSDAGGLSRYIYDLCLAMQSAGHQVAVAGQRGDWHHLFESAPFPWIDAPLKSGPLGLRRAANLLSAHLRDHPVDILHAHYRRCTLVARKLQHDRRPPLLYTLHLSHIPMGFFRRRFTDFGDHTHVPAAAARQWLIDATGVEPQRITAIPHGIDPQQFPLADSQTKIQAKSDLGLSPTDIVAAYVGRLDTPKNELWLLNLAVASRSRIPNLKLLIAGAGPHEMMIGRHIHRRGLSDRVTLLGQRDPLPIYQAADALLLPSAREGFSLVCAEAMSVGVPVLRTRTAGTEELILENQTGRSVPIDHNAFVAGAIEFLCDPAALRRMGAAAANHIRANFTFDRQLRDTIALYYSLAQKSA